MINLRKFETEAQYNAYADSSEYVIPNVSSISEVEGMVKYNKPHDYSKDYLTTVAKETGTISFNIWKNMGTDLITSISYSTDGGETWITTQNQNNKSESLVINVNVNEGDMVLWKGDAQQTGFYDEDGKMDSYVGSFFSSTAEFDAEGNIMSLLYGDNFIGETELENAGQCACLFSDYNGEKECLVVNAENLILPATTLVDGCYIGMFRGCTSLTTAPVLPATTLANDCYNGMFQNCSSLTTAPVLPATTLSDGCYGDMFNGCSSLTTAPELPATTLANYCYSYMFSHCSSLTAAPELPATTLAEGCYDTMFWECTSLTTVPVLPATTLVDECYNQTFLDCSSLNYIKCLATDISANNCTNWWVHNVASTGTFVKNPNMSDWTTGISGIPNGWAIQDAS